MVEANKNRLNFIATQCGRRRHFQIGMLMSAGYLEIALLTVCLVAAYLCPAGYQRGAGGPVSDRPTSLYAADLIKYSRRMSAVVI